MKQYGRPRFMQARGGINLCCYGGRKYCRRNDADGCARGWRKRARRAPKGGWE